jgi:hypothetical protein
VARWPFHCEKVLDSGSPVLTVRGLEMLKRKSQFLSYRLLHDRLTEGFEIAPSRSAFECPALCIASRPIGIGEPLALLVGRFRIALISFAADAADFWYPPLSFRAEMEFL